MRFFYKKWLTCRYTRVLDNRQVRQHTGVLVYNGICLELWYAVAAAGTQYDLQTIKYKY